MYLERCKEYLRHSHNKELFQEEPVEIFTSTNNYILQYPQCRVFIEECTNAMGNRIVKFTYSYDETPVPFHSVIDKDVLFFDMYS